MVNFQAANLNLPAPQINEPSSTTVSGKSKPVRLRNLFMHRQGAVMTVGKGDVVRVVSHHVAAHAASAIRQL